MNDEINPNITMPLAIAGGIGIAGVVVGTIISFLLPAIFKPAGPPNLPRGQGKAAAPTIIHVLITLYDGNKCVQTVDGVRYGFPPLKRPTATGGPGDQVEWQGLDANSGNAVPISVTFQAPSPFTRPTFTSSNGNPAGPSGPVTGSPNDYFYSAVSVNDTPCSNWDPGVHVNQ
jgi:hypothetical protein